MSGEDKELEFEDTGEEIDEGTPPARDAPAEADPEAEAADLDTEDEDEGDAVADVTLDPPETTGGEEEEEGPDVEEPARRVDEEEEDAREADEEEGKRAADDEEEADEGKDKVEVDDDDDEGDGNLAAIVGGKKNKMMADKVGREKNEKRRFYGLVGLGICLFLILLVILGIVFSPNTGAAATKLVNPVVPTTAPTERPTTATETPTTTPQPTPEDVQPTENPTTSPPTTPTITPVSRLPCDLIKLEDNVTALNFGENNFKIYERPGKEPICGDTFGGPDPERPNRNHWAVRYGRRDCVKRGFDEGTDLCLFIGARRCTLDEMQDGVAQGTGCGGDRELVYTGTPCETGDGEDGIFMFDFGLRDFKEGSFECETDLDRESIIRCCGDNFEV